MKIKPVTIFLVGIFAFAVWFRILYYGDLRLSIGTNDTPSYIDSSRPPLFSWESFSGRRLFTTNLVYKLGNDTERCTLPVISQPAMGTEGHREVKSCFDDIALLQNIVSIAGWCMLAWMAARWLFNPALKIVAASVILVFGFTPQIAEWDSVLGAESLSMSLFAIMFALLLEIGYRLAGREEQPLDAINLLLVSVWILVFTLWVFVRDVHLYAIPLILALSLPFLFSRKIRKQTHILPAGLILILILFLGNYSSRESTRWQTSLDNNFTGFIFPYPARVEYFSALGLPESRSGPNYDAWLKEHGLRAYGGFIATHPGFVVTTLLEQSEYFKSSFFQPYYKLADAQFRQILLTIGEIVHPETNAIYLIDVLILLSLCLRAARQRERYATVRAWLAVWMFGYSSLSLVFSFFGDTNGVHRHIYPSVELFRLFFWIFLLQVLDAQAENGKHSFRSINPAV